MRETWKHFDIIPDDIVLSECGIQAFSPDQGYSYTVTENFVLHYIEAGKGFLQINNHTYLSDNFNGFILKRGQRVTYKADPDDPWKTYWIGIKGDYLKQFLNKLQLHNKDVIQFSDDSVSVQLIKDICQTTRDTPDISYLWYKSKTYALLLTLEQEFKSSDYIDYHADPITGVYDYICNNYHANFSNEDLSLLFGISRNTLFDKFKTRYHTTPKRFVLEHRINKASQLLRETDFPVKTIAAMVGFEEYFSFSKSFKKIMKTSPKAYRAGGTLQELHEVP